MIFAVKLHAVAWFTQKKIRKLTRVVCFPKSIFFQGLCLCFFFPEYMFPHLDGDGHLRTDQSLSATEIWS